MKEFTALFGSLIFTVLWFDGIYVASGFWQTLFSLFPPVGMYFGFVDLRGILIG